MMEQDPKPTPTLTEIDAQAPKKGEYWDAAVGGAGNALFVATPLKLMLDHDAGKGVVSKYVTPWLHEQRNKLALGVGAAVALGGFVQGMRSARQLCEWRQAKHEYLEAQERRIHQLETQVSQLSSQARQTLNAAHQPQADR